MINIAIDGPSGAGKSTIAKALARKLSYLYVDTGALYRSIGLYALRKGVKPSDSIEVPKLLPEIALELKHIDGTQYIYLNGEDVTSEVRSQDVAMAASTVSALPEVRAFLLDLQRNIAKENNSILDGRDIGTVVLPNATHKIFLTASADERARRRLQDLKNSGVDTDFETVLKEINERDFNDTNREIAPLKQADDAILYDTTGQSIEESIAGMVELVSNGKETPKVKPKKEKAKKEEEKLYFDYEKTQNRIMYYFLFIIAFLVGKICFRVKYRGKENVPKGRPLIFASNHVSLVDPVLIAVSRVRILHPMGKVELFEKPFLGWLFRNANAFPIKRGSSDKRGIEYAIRLIEEGKCIILFPEGARSPDHKPGRGKNGVSLIAKAAKADILPVAVFTDGKPMKPFKTRATVRFGKVIPYEDLNLDGGGSKALREGTRRIMGEITELWEEGY